jgi:hypothetical protein
VDLETLAIRTYIGEPDRGPLRGLIKTPNGMQCTRIAGVSEAPAANGSCADAENC